MAADQWYCSETSTNIYTTGNNSKVKSHQSNKTVFQTPRQPQNFSWLSGSRKKSHSYRVCVVSSSLQLANWTKDSCRKSSDLRKPTKFITSLGLSHISYLSCAYHILVGSCCTNPQGFLLLVRSASRGGGNPNTSDGLVQRLCTCFRIRRGANADTEPIDTVVGYSTMVLRKPSE